MESSTLDFIFIVVFLSIILGAGRAYASKKNGQGFFKISPFRKNDASITIGNYDSPSDLFRKYPVGNQMVTSQWGLWKLGVISG
ncbi:MAG: hypothetical protein CR994_09385 [Maribacter sp.]|nr:MAG: hypothetical protein CR994_09385 [Maribacter sp.]